MLVFIWLTFGSIESHCLQLEQVSPLTLPNLETHSQAFPEVYLLSNLAFLKLAISVNQHTLLF